MTEDFDQFDIDINDDVNGSVEIAVKEAVKAIEQEPTKEVEPVTPQEQVTDEEPKGYSTAALFAESFKKEKGLFADKEIKKDLSPEELQEMLLEAAVNLREEDKEKYLQEREEAERQRLLEKGLTDDHLTYIQQIINGADPQIVSKVAQYRAWSEAELEGEDEMEAAIRAGLRLQLSNNPNADDLIEAYREKNVTGKGTDALQEQSAKFQEYIGQVADYLQNQDNQRLDAQRARAREAEERFANDTQKQIESGVYGIEWRKPEQKKLHDYMTKKSVVVDINGRKEKVTQEQADMIRDRQDMSKRVFEAYQRMTGFTKLTNAATSTAQNKFLKAVKEQEEPKRTTVALPQQQRADVLEEFDYEF
jgi:hypothetical protein